jgi:hypothetical protein
MWSVGDHKRGMQGSGGLSGGRLHVGWEGCVEVKGGKLGRAIKGDRLDTAATGITR